MPALPRSRQPHNDPVNLTTAATPSSQLSRSVLPDALRGSKPWPPSGSQ